MHLTDASAASLNLLVQTCRVPICSQTSEVRRTWSRSARHNLSGERLRFSEDGVIGNLGWTRQSEASNLPKKRL